jgi:hypothetical protein
VGFTPRGKVYVLDFTGDAELDGLTVRARSAPIGMVLDMGELAAAIDDNPAGQAGVLAQMAKMRPVLEKFADVLLSWDLEVKPGEPTPANLDGLLQVDTGQVMRILTAWQKAVSDVPAPLPEPSSGGGPSLEGSLPMEPLSASPAA